MIPTLPALPWYTWSVLLLASLMVLGAAWSLARGLLGAVGGIAWSAWHSLALSVAALARRWELPLASAGSSHWASDHELETAGVWREEGLPLATRDGRTIHEPRGGHVLVMAPPRTGKSTGLLVPMLRDYPGAAVMLDTRGELFTLTEAARAAKGPVYRFQPGAADSASLNLLDLCPGYGDMHRVMTAVVHPEPRQPFDRPAIPVLTSLALHLQARGSASLPAMVEWLTDPATSVRDKLATLVADRTPHVAAGARLLADEAPGVRLAVWGRMVESLSMYLDPEIAAVTRHSELDLRTLHDDVRPISLYVGIGLHDVERMQHLLHLLLETLILAVSRPRAELPRHRLLLALDECANAGHMASLERGVSTLQGSGCQAVLVFQNLGQLESVYGRSTPLLASMSALVAYAPSPADSQTAAFLSASTGVTTVMAPSVTAGTGTRQDGGLLTWRRSTSTSQSVTHRATARPLLTADEVRTLPPEAALVFLQGVAPIMGAKLNTLPPSTLQKTLRAVVAHPGLVALPMAAILAGLALQPLWAHLQAPTPQAQHRPDAGTNSLAQFATPSAPEAPSRPQAVPTAEASVPPREAPPVSQTQPHLRARVLPSEAPKPAPTPAPPPPERPWALWASQPFFKQPSVKQRFATEADCLAELKRIGEAEVEKMEKAYTPLKVMNFKAYRESHKIGWSTQSSGMPPEEYAHGCTLAKAP